VLIAVTSVGEVNVIFLQLILFANTATFFYSLLGFPLGHDSARTRVETVSIRAQLALRGTVHSFLREGCMATKFCIDLTQACGDMM